MNLVKEQLTIFGEIVPKRPKGQLLKWVGNKFRYANEIVKMFPIEFNKYIEPFVGTGAILATLAPKKAIAGDILKELIEMWNIIKSNPEELIKYYEKHINLFYKDKYKTYQEILDRYNRTPNPYDLVLISRTCYGGVIRFTKEGKISTPIGPHNPIRPIEFARRVRDWRDRVKYTTFINQSFEITMDLAEKGDLIYCDPPYIDSQKILYGAQNFNFELLIEKIEECKRIGAKVALSIDGKKKSGTKVINLNVPKGLFVRELYINNGSSMLKRFQKSGLIMTGEDVQDRLLLTW